MTPNKYRLTLDSCQPKECRNIKMEEALEFIKFSENCIVVSSHPNGEIEVLFTGFTEAVLNDLIIAMSYHTELFNFVKLAVIASEDIRKEGKKGMSIAESAATYLKKKLNN